MHVVRVVIVLWVALALLAAPVMAYSVGYAVLTNWFDVPSSTAHIGAIAYGALAGALYTSAALYYASIYVTQRRQH